MTTGAGLDGAAGVVTLMVGLGLVAVIWLGAYQKK